MRADVRQSGRMGKLVGQNGGTSTGVWLRLAKKGVEQRTVTYEQAVESALCHGWIDGQKKAESGQYWLQRFSPRSAKSIWSKINKDKAEALIAAGRMQPSGLSEIDRARKDGRWEAAYTSASNSIVPDDLQAALDANPKAAKFFATLNSRIAMRSCSGYRTPRSRKRGRAKSRNSSTC